MAGFYSSLFHSTPPLAPTHPQIADVQAFISSSWAPDIPPDPPKPAPAPAPAPAAEPASPARRTMASFLAEDATPLTPPSPRRAASPAPAPGTTVASLFGDLQPVSLSDNPLFGVLSPLPEHPVSRVQQGESVEPIQLSAARCDRGSAALLHLLLGPAPASPREIRPNQKLVLFLY